VLAKYELAAQEVVVPHGSPLGPGNPALQTQAVMAVSPICDLEFTGQPKQAVLPVTDLYVPAVHSTHVSPLGLADPALQRQAVMAVLPIGEMEFQGHVSQNMLSPVSHAKWPNIKKYSLET